MHSFSRFSVLLFILSAGTLSAEEVRFTRDIRPILSTSCNKCHGPDDAHREADLRLDNEEGIRHAFNGGLKDSEA